MTLHSTIDITLQGREYRVTCPPDERDALLAAVAYVETKMAEISAKSKSSGERVAVMVALNLAHELLDLKAAPVSPTSPVNTASEIKADTTSEGALGFDRQEFARRIENMQARLDAAMVQQDSLL